MSDVLLPPLPNFREWPYTHEELRARDLEVARVVLEAAAFHLRGADKHLTDLQISDQIRALEVRHHE